jgi:hypothetical protein
VRRLLTLSAFFCLAAVLLTTTAGAQSQVTKSFVLSSATGGDFTVSGALPANTHLASAKTSRRALADYAAYLVSGKNKILVASAHSSTRQTPRSAKQVATALAKSEKGSVKSAYGRYQILHKGAIVAVVIAADADVPQAFAFALIKDGGQGQKLMRALSYSARAWLGHSDPKQIKSDPAGLALLAKVKAAIASRTFLTLNFSDSTGTFVLHAVQADSYSDDYYQGQLNDWQKGKTSLAYDASTKCWRAVPAIPVSFNDPFNGFAVKVQAPWQLNGDTIVSWTGYIDNTLTSPDANSLAIDLTTNLPKWGTLESGDGKNRSKSTETWDFTTAVQEQPQPTSICA